MVETRGLGSKAVTLIALVVAWALAIAPAWPIYSDIGVGVPVAGVVMVATCVAITLVGWTSNWRWAVIGASYLALASFGVFENWLNTPWPGVFV